jgi:LacI family transcriptional regulator
MQTITIKILAEKLKLSRSTVSKALSDSYEISQATKARVQAMAAKLNYAPNPYASSLRKKSSKTIAVVLPEVADSFFAQAINGIEAAAQEKGYHVLIYLTHENFLKEKAIIKDVQNGRIDGVLMSISSESTSYAHLHELGKKGIPVVFFDRVCPDIATAKITTNDYESAYRATRHLIECGCKKLAFLAISKSLLITEERIKGYSQALADNGITFNKGSVLFCTDDMEQNYAIVKKLLGKPNRPDGIISAVEKLATSIYSVCNEMQLPIPSQLKIVCFTNLQTAPLLHPPLTTITQPAFNMGKTAATVLFKALKKGISGLPKESLVIPSVLVIRHSTAPIGTPFSEVQVMPGI